VVIRFVSVVGSEDTVLLETAVKHYRAMGVESFHLVRHVESLDDPGLRSSEQVLGRHGLRFATVHQGPWDEDLNAYLIRAQMRRHPEDWWVVADADEFHVYDRPLAEIIAMCEHAEYDYVRGAFLDRVAANGLLQPFDPARSIWRQYELAGFVTLHVTKAATSKVTLARGDVVLNLGQHSTKSGRQAPADRVFAQVHHFKWTSSLPAKLTRRVGAYSSNEWHVAHPSIATESHRILDHLSAHGGRIDVDREELLFRRCGHQYADYSPWRRMTDILSSQIRLGLPLRSTESGTSTTAR
jgi:hypothetical protein